MEFVRQEIQNDTCKVKNAMQFTMDDTINVPENMLDMERLILVKGNVVPDEMQAMVDRFQVKGTLRYDILYCADQEGNVFETISGSVPFVEYINADGTGPEDYIEVHASLNDLTVTMLHSRKLSLKALVGLDYQVKASRMLAVISEVTGDDSAEVYSKRDTVMCLRKQSRERVAMKTEAEIPANKPDLYQVIWKSLSVTGATLRPEDGYALLQGTLNVFFVYHASEDEMPIQYFSLEIPFERRIEQEETDADMISGSDISLVDYHVAILPDESGHDRRMEIDAEFVVEWKLYGKEERSLVRDIYSTAQELVPKCETFAAQHLLVRNCAKMKVSDTVTLSKQTILQICHAEGSVSVEDTQASANGITVEGVLGTQITYLSKDKGELASANYDIPFSYEIEIAGMGEDVSYTILPSLDRMQAVQSGESEIEIRAEVSLDVLAFTNENVCAVLDVLSSPSDSSVRQKMPGMTGYIVKQGDTLWSIAKTYRTTVDRIRQINELSEDGVDAGDRLLILKEA